MSLNDDRSIILRKYMFIRDKETFLNMRYMSHYDVNQLLNQIGLKDVKYEFAYEFIDGNFLCAIMNKVVSLNLLLKYPAGENGNNGCNECNIDNEFNGDNDFNGDNGDNECSKDVKKLVEYLKCVNIFLKTQNKFRRIEKDARNYWKK